MYKSVGFSVAIACMVAAFILPQPTFAKFGEPDALFVCVNGTLKPSLKLVPKLMSCNQPDLYTERNIKCIAVCTTEAVGGMKDGVPNEENFDHLIKTEFPEDQQADALERMKECFKGRTFDKTDETCSAVADFSVCGTKVVTDTKCVGGEKTPEEPAKEAPKDAV